MSMRMRPVVRTAIAATVMTCLAAAILLAGAMAGATAGPAAAREAGVEANTVVPDWPDPRLLEYPELREIRVPSPERITLPNGMLVYLLEDHDFPLVDVRALLRVGSIYEPAEKVGLADITAEVMRTGGTQRHPGDELDRRLESMGGSIEFDVQNTQASASVSVLSDNLNEGLAILADLLRRPVFPEEKLELARNQEKTAVASRNDESMDILGRELPKLIYGADHPYARHTEYATLDAITRDDLVGFHQEFFHPDRIILTIYGDFKSAAVKKLLSAQFGDWKRSTSPLPPDPPIATKPARGLYLAHKGDATNTVVILGHLGMRMDDPDYPAMAVLHEIVGGGFSSRLLNEIRTKRGLAYAAGSFSGAAYHHPSASIFYAITRADSTMATAGYVRQEAERVVREPVTEQELAHARDALLNSLVFTLSSKRAILNRLAEYEFYGYPKDFLQTYQEAIRGLTPESVLAAAERKIRPAEFATLLVGNRAAIEPGLDPSVPFAEVDISIPDPASARTPEGSAADFADGARLLAEAAQAAGAAGLAGVVDVKLEEKGGFNFRGMEIAVSSRTWIKMPDCLRREQQSPMGTVVQACCGTEGWMQVGPNVHEMDGDALSGMLSERRRDLLQVLRSPEGLRAQLLPADVEINGRPAAVLAVQDDIVQAWRIYIDRESKLIVRMEYTDRNPMGEGPRGTHQETWTDFRTVNGIQWPHEKTIAFADEELARFAVTGIEVNSGIDPVLYERPAD